MKFPLSLTFKILAIAPQINIVDADGTNVCYVRQKLMKLKEQIEVFADKSKSQKIGDIRANKVLDFSATYQFSDNAGQPLGAVARKGMKSIWRANYNIMDEDQKTVMKIREEKPWVKVIDGLLGEIPVVGFFTGYLLNPSYIISDAASDEHLVRIRKIPALWEGRFVLDKLGEFEEADELRIAMASMVLVQMERSRG